MEGTIAAGAIHYQQQHQEEAPAAPSPPPRAAGAPLGELDINQILQQKTKVGTTGTSSTITPSGCCSWTINALKIPNTAGKNAIDLMKHKDYDLILPPELYTPTWDGRKTLIKAITESAMHQGKTSLTQLTADKKFGRIVLGCNKGRPYRENKHYLNKKKKNNSAPHHSVAAEGTIGCAANTSQTVGDDPLVDVILGHVPQYKEGVRQDRIVNKNAAIRGQAGLTGNGKKLARRSSTKKPSPDNLCQFKIRLKLEENEQWIVKRMHPLEQFHNHMNLDKNELVTRRAHLTDDQEENCRRYLHFTNAGAATNILNEELGGFTLSQQSARYIYQQRQNANSGMQCTTDDHCGEEPPSTSTANRLILLMDRLARDGHLRYVALYHEAKETTLLAISKAAEKNWKKEVQKARTEAANGLLTLSQMMDNDQHQHPPTTQESFLNESLSLSISDSNCHEAGCFTLNAPEDTCTKPMCSAGR